MTAKLRTHSVEFTASDLVVTLADGRKIATPLDWYPRLKLATAQKRANFEIMPMGMHWPDLDEDLSVLSSNSQESGCCGDCGACLAAARPSLRGVCWSSPRSSSS